MRKSEGLPDVAHARSLLPQPCAWPRTSWHAHNSALSLSLSLLASGCWRVPIPTPRPSTLAPTHACSPLRRRHEPEGPHHARAAGHVPAPGGTRAQPVLAHGHGDVAAGGTEEAEEQEAEREVASGTLVGGFSGLQLTEIEVDGDKQEGLWCVLKKHEEEGPTPHVQVRQTPCVREG